MATTLDEHLTYYRTFRSQILEDLEGYTSGRRTTGEIRNDTRVDTTAETIADLKRRLVALDQVTAAYEGQQNAARS